MESLSRIRRKMTYLIFGGFILGLIMSIFYDLTIFETFFDAWWLDLLVPFLIIFAGFFVMFGQIDKICGVIQEELAKRGKASEKQSERME